MSLSVTIPAAVKAVPLTVLKEHLRVDGITEDALIEGYLGAAVGWVEEYLRRGLINRTYKLTLDAFPSSGEIELPAPCVSAISSVKYYDESGVLTTLSASNYWPVLDEVAAPGLVILKSTASWPDLQEDRPRAVEVLFVAGYGATEDNVPDDVRQAVILLAAHLFEQRVPYITGTIISPVQHTLEALLHAHRFHNFA